MKRTVWIISMIAAFLAFAVAPSLAKTVYLKQATSQVGGTWYVFGGAISGVISKYVEGVSLTAVPTGGAFENIELLKNGKVDIAQFLPGMVYQSYNAEGRYKGKPPYKELRFITRFYGAPHHFIVLKKSPINSLGELKGKRVGPGQPGEQDWESSDILLKALEYGPKDIQLITASKKDRIQALGDGKLDAVFIFVGTGSGMITELSNSHDIRLLPVEEEIIKKIQKDYPYFDRGIIRAGTYKGQDKDVVTLWLNGVIACNASLDEKVVYGYTKAYWDHFDEIVKAYAPAREVTLKDTIADGTFGIPIHPGAERYYREKGLIR